MLLSRIRAFFILIWSHISGFLEKLDSFFDSIASGFIKLTEFRHPRTGDRLTIGHSMKRLRTDVTESMEIVGEKLKDIEKPLEKFIKRITSKTDMNYFVKNVWPVFIIATLLFGASALYIVREIEIVADYRVYLPQGDETKENFDAISQYWGTDTITIYAKTTGENSSITSVENLKIIRQLENTLNYNHDGKGTEDGIFYIQSINYLIHETYNATALDLRPRQGPDDPLNDQATVDDIIASLPENLRNNMIRDRDGDGVYDAASITISITAMNQSELYYEIYDTVHNITELDMELTGNVALATHITEHTRFQLVQVIPFALLLGIVIIFALHRDLKAVFITGVPTVYAMVYALAIATAMNGMSIPLFGEFVIVPQIAITAPVILGLGVDYGLHIINRFSEEEGSDEKRIRKIFRTTGKALVMSSITTVVGFIALAFSSFIPLVLIGITLAIGIFLALIMTFLLTPGLMVALKYKKKQRFSTWKKIAKYPANYRYIILIVTALITIASIGSINNLDSDVNYYTMGPENSSVTQNSMEYTEVFESGNYDLVMVKALAVSEVRKYEGTLKDPAVLEHMEELQLSIDEIEGVSTISIIDVMKSVVVHEFDAPISFPGAPVIPEKVTVWWLITNDSAENMFDKLPDIFPYSSQADVVNKFYSALSPEAKFQLVSEDYNRALIVVLSPVSGVDASEVIVDKINKLIDENQVGSETTHLTGGASIIVAINSLLITNQLLTTALASVLVFITLTAIFKNIKIAFITMIPMLLVLSWQPLVMIMLGVPLSIITVMIGSMIMGMGIDYGIHISERIMEEKKESGKITKESIEEAVRTSGMSITEAVITTMGGLGAALIIDMTAIREFLLIAMILVGFSVIGAILVLPSMYISIISRTRFRRKKKPQSIEEKLFSDDTCEDGEEGEEDEECPEEKEKKDVQPKSRKKGPAKNSRAKS